MRNLRGILGTALELGLLVTAVCLFAFAAGAGGTASPDFSGTYVLSKTEGYPLPKGRTFTMNVVENGSSIQVTRGGMQQMSTVFPLKGKTKCATMIAMFMPGMVVAGGGHPAMQFPGASATQPVGTCSAKMKGKKLTLQSSALVPMNGSESTAELTEHWDFPQDSNNLRIKYELVVTNSPVPGRSFVVYYVRK